MSKGGGQQQQTTTTQVQLPAWLDQAAQANLATANEIAAKPFEAFGGDRVAGLSGLEQTGLNIAGSTLSPDRLALAQSQAEAGAANAGAGAGLTINSGSSLAGMAPGTAAIADRFLGTAGGIGELISRGQAAMNPYTAEVVDRGIADLERTGEAQRRAAVDRASRSGAWGDRLGVAEGVQAAETARAAGTLSAQLRDQAWQRGMAAGAQSIQLDQAGLTGAVGARGVAGQHLAQAGGLGAAGAQAGATAAGAAGIPISQGLGFAQGGLTIGGLPRALEQAELDQAFADWRAEQDYPIEMLGLRMGAVSATPYGGTTTNSTPIYKPSGFASGLGGVASGAAAGVPFAGMTGGWSIPIGAALGGLGGLLGR